MKQGWLNTMFSAPDASKAKHPRSASHPACSHPVMLFLLQTVWTQLLVSLAAPTGTGTTAGMGCPVHFSRQSFIQLWGAISTGCQPEWS